MNVTEAVTSRRSVRQFLDRPVDKTILEQVLSTAQRSPSGGNVQPWNAVVLTGDPLEALFAKVAAKAMLGKAGQEMEYDIYPKHLADPYESRRFGVGEALYAALEVPREDRAGRLKQFAQNFRGFGAPVQLFVYTPRYMGPPQWADMGMWLQTIMLLLREAGLDSCAQEAWAVYGATVRAHLGIADDHILYCGMAIGYRDAENAVNRFDVPRAELSETVSFLGF